MTEMQKKIFSLIFQNVLFLSMITNICVLDYDSQEAANHEEVIETAAARGKDMEALVTALMPKL